MAEKEPRKRFSERRHRDDEDDDERPVKRTRRDDEDGDAPERSRRRAVSGDRPPVLFLVGLAAGAFLLLGCCGVGGWGAYSALVGNSGGGGWSLFGGNEVEVVSATRAQNFFGVNAAPTVSWTTVGKKTVPPGPYSYFLVMQCGGKTHPIPHPFPVKDSRAELTVTAFEFRNTTGPIELWVEKRTNPNAPGKRVSNVYKVP